jgi:hypothetical protein
MPQPVKLSDALIDAALTESARATRSRARPLTERTVWIFCPFQAGGRMKLV